MKLNQKIIDKIIKNKFLEYLDESNALSETSSGYRCPYCSDILVLGEKHAFCPSCRKSVDIFNLVELKEGITGFVNQAKFLQEKYGYGDIQPHVCSYMYNKYFLSDDFEDNNLAYLVSHDDGGRVYGEAVSYNSVLASYKELENNRDCKHARILIKGRDENGNTKQAVMYGKETILPDLSAISELRWDYHPIGSYGINFNFEKTERAFEIVVAIKPNSKTMFGKDGRSLYSLTYDQYMLYAQRSVYDNQKGFLPLPTYVTFTENRIYLHFSLANSLLLLPKVRKKYKNFQSALQLKIEKTLKTEHLHWNVEDPVPVCGIRNTEKGTYALAFRTGSPYYIDEINMFVPKKDTIDGVKEKLKRPSAGTMKAAYYYGMVNKVMTDPNAKMPGALHLIAEFGQKEGFDAETVRGNMKEAVSKLMGIEFYSIDNDAIVAPFMEFFLTPGYYSKWDFDDIQRTTGIVLKKRKNKKTGLTLENMFTRNILKLNKFDKIYSWRLANPEGTRKECAVQTGVSLRTVIRWWKYDRKRYDEEYVQSVKDRTAVMAEKSKKSTLAYKNKMFQKELASLRREKKTRCEKCGELNGFSDNKKVWGHFNHLSKITDLFGYNKKICRYCGDTIHGKKHKISRKQYDRVSKICMSIVS